MIGRISLIGPIRRIWWISGTIEESRDPYFIPLLERRRADLNFPEIRRIATLPAEYLAINIKSTLKSFYRALEALEAEQVK